MAEDLKKLWDSTPASQTDLQALWNETPEAAVTGNPLAARKYGGPKDTSRLDPLAAISGAGTIGTVTGALAPEILQGLSVATRGAIVHSV